MKCSKLPDSSVTSRAFCPARETTIRCQSWFSRTLSTPKSTNATWLPSGEKRTRVHDCMLAPHLRVEVTEICRCGIGFLACACPEGTVIIPITLVKSRGLVITRSAIGQHDGNRCRHL